MSDIKAKLFQYRGRLSALRAGQTFQECLKKEDFMLMVNKINLFHLFSKSSLYITLQRVDESRESNYEIRKIFTWLNPESINTCCWIWNPWFRKSRTHSKESWILLPVIQKPRSTGTESGNPESKTRTTFHGFPHSRTSCKPPPKARRLGGCLRVSKYYESLSRRGPKTSAFKQRLFTCSLYTLSLIKVLYTLERLVLIMNIEIRPRVSWSPTAG